MYSKYEMRKKSLSKILDKKSDIFMNQKHELMISQFFFYLFILIRLLRTRIQEHVSYR